MKAGVAIAALIVLGMMLPALAADNMNAFPPPEKGMVRYVLQLPKQEDESTFKVELVAGKTVRLDERNRYFFPGEIRKEDIKGWGFTRHIVSRLGPLAGTQMAIDPHAPRVSRFIALGGEPYLIRYNSRLPVVVYAPEGVEVRYRVWSGGPEAQALKEG
jgi:ecotin